MNDAEEAIRGNNKIGLDKGKASIIELDIEHKRSINSALSGASCRLILVHQLLPAMISRHQNEQFLV